RDFHVTGVQTCALPISPSSEGGKLARTPDRGGIRARAGGVTLACEYNMGRTQALEACAYLRFVSAMSDAPPRIAAPRRCAGSHRARPGPPSAERPAAPLRRGRAAGVVQDPP